MVGFRFGFGLGFGFGFGLGFGPFEKATKNRSAFPHMEHL
jgi:hypothetical protein